MVILVLVIIFDRERLLADVEDNNEQAVYEEENPEFLDALKKEQNEITNFGKNPQEH